VLDKTLGARSLGSGGYCGTDNADLRVSLGAGIVDARKKTTAAFEPLGVESVQMTEQRWSVPVDVGLNYRF
jgi:hypothetical protein